MSRTLTLVGYAVLATAVVAYEVAGRLWRRTPTLGQALDRVAAWAPARALLLAAWLWAGWHVFVRTGGP